MMMYDYLTRNLPHYYPTMFMDGYTPVEIYQSHQRDIMEEYQSRQNIPTVKLISEIRVK